MDGAKKLCALGVSCFRVFHLDLGMQRALTGLTGASIRFSKLPCKRSGGRAPSELGWYVPSGNSTIRGSEDGVFFTPEFPDWSRYGGEVDSSSETQDSPSDLHRGADPAAHRVRRSPGQKGLPRSDGRLRTPGRQAQLDALGVHAAGAHGFLPKAAWKRRALTRTQ